jgi:Tfp pilus assembly protein PilF
MPIRPKTKRRVMILGLVALLIVGAGAAVYFRYVQKRNAELAAWRSAAMAAYAAGDYAAALPHFAKYHTEARTGQLPRDRVDLEALFAYARSRASVEMQPGSRHLSEARQLIERYLALKPGDEEAERMLLDIYPRLNMNQEAVNTADGVLARRPDDVRALKSKTKALIQKGMQQDPRSLAEAVATGDRLNRVAPLDVEGQLLTQFALVATKKPAAEVVARADALLKEHPDDPRFELLLASAHLYFNQFAEARRWLAAAAARPAPDEASVTELVTRLDVMGMFRQSQEVLDRAAARFPADPSLTRAAVQRQWQSKRYEDVVNRLAPLDPAGPKADAALLGLRALSLYELGKRQEAKTIVDALARRGSSDSTAVAWSTALAARYAEPPLPPRGLAEKYKAALDKDPANAVLHAFRGEAFDRLGETTLAVDAWSEAARRAPSWALPRRRVAAAMASEGRYADAVRVAEDAYKRDRGDLSVVVTWAQAAYGLLETMPDQKELDRLLRAVEEIQQAAPGEPTTLPIYAAVLARSGRRDDAINVIKGALAADPPPPPQVVARLAAVSRDNGLGLDGAAAQKLRGNLADGSPSAAFAAAVERNDAGKPAEGVTLLNEARAKATNVSPAEEVQWKLALAQYLDLTHDAGALAGWVGLADANPNDLSVQSAALRARCRQQDRAFWRRTIDRVKQLTVENSQLWRLEEARWLLTGEMGEKEQASVLATLTELARNAPYSAEPHRLLAVAHERSAASATPQGQAAAMRLAAEEMAKASDLRPADVGIVAELARLLRAAGRADEVGRFLDRAAGGRVLGRDERLRLADLYAQQGQPKKAIELASPLGADAAPRLARWYRATGQPQQAVDLYAKLLDAPGLDAQTALDAAGFFAGQGDADQAEKFLARLDSLPGLQPGAKELVRAKFAERHRPAEATGWYEKAAAAPGAPAGVWRELAGHHLRHRRFAEALAAAAIGLEKFPQDADLQAMQARAHELEPLGQDRSVTPLLGYLSFDPRNAPANEMLTVLRRSRGPGRGTGGADPAAAAEAVAAMRAAADKYPGFLPLQAAAVRAHLRAGEPQKAEAVARRAASTFPDDVEAVRLVAAVYAAMGRWTELREAATTWRRLTPDQPLEPDLLVARAMLNTNESGAAADRVAPYAKAEAAKGGQANLEVLDLYARALIAAGKANEAASFLEPLARQGAAARRLWLDLAGAFRSLDREAAAQWVLRVEPMVSKDVPQERRDLATGWYVVGREFNDRESLSAAKSVAQPLTADKDASLAAEALTILASCDEALGDLASAEAQYRKALVLRRGQPAVLNNLAYVLLHKGGEAALAEAHELASAATAAAPNVSSFHDTLARVEAKRGRLDAAVTSFRKALALEPNSLEAMIGLADVLTQTGKRDEARQQLAQIDNALVASPRLSPELKAQLEAVRTNVRRQAESRAE